tara:strand:+ start:78 stop:2024 length:1947 start_codon:yes stop_codon:yes gene_type:complete
MSTNDLFNKANKFFLNKDYFKGLQLYKEILAKYPKNTRLNEEVKKQIKKFKNPILPTYKKEEIDNFFQLQKNGETSVVINILLDNLKKNPSDILTMSLLGTFYNYVKEYKKAENYQKVVILRSPLEVSFYLNLYETFQKSGEFEEALSVLQYAKILTMNDISIDHKIAMINTKMKRFSKADLIYKNLIKEKNIDISILKNYLDNLIKLKKESEAIQFIESYKKTKTLDDDLTLLLGTAYLEQKKIYKAIDYFSEIIESNPLNENALNLLGNSYEKLGNIKKAKYYYDQSLKLNPKNNTALINLASLSFYEGDIEKATTMFTEVIKEDNNYNALYSLALCQLAQSKFDEGWKNFKFRWFSNLSNSTKLESKLPEFCMNSEKKNVLVWGEQGLGDEVFFLRFLSRLEPFVHNIYLKLDKRLTPIIKRNLPNADFINHRNEISENNIDCQLPIGNLSSLFIKKISDLKNNSKKYIKSDPIRTNDLKNYLKQKGQIICGLSWISKNEDIGASKSLSLDILKPILSLPNIKFIDLQYNDTKDEREQFFQENNISINKIDDIDSFNDIEGITSLIDACDFIITVSNTNAHIAGALGKKTFLLLPKGKGRLWYWSFSKNKSDWYSSIEVIEQDFPGEWKPVIKKVGEKVMSFVSE